MAIPRGLLVERFRAAPVVDGGYRGATQFAGSCVVTQRWQARQSSWPLAGFAFLWDAFILTFLIAEPRAALCLSLHLGAGAFLSYLGLAGLLNRTTIELSADRLSVRHGPLPWRGGFAISTSMISGFRVVSTPGDDDDGRKYVASYDVLCDTTQGRSHRVMVSWGNTPDQADHVASLLRRALGLPDALSARASEDGAGEQQDEEPQKTEPREMRTMGR